VMSTITPPSTAIANGAASRISPTQSPVYRVLVKGERLTPRRGRADDQVWPRVEAAPAAALKEPVETGTAPVGEPPVAP
jgi:uncharacterized protein